ncbi:uncharacterized protein JCM15063_001271 [Sporobolomyces koalae]|uniref:uncharacterized protein n=1 Tax=Sporobolomyces koalae TaxID=500713 RepID=UPI0031788023
MDQSASPPPLPARPIVRESSRPRSMRSQSSTHDDPLSSPSAGPALPEPSTSPGGPYAVYNSYKKRSTTNPLSTDVTSATSPPRLSSSSTTTTSSSASPSTIPTPPFHPTIALAPPPLVSRPSNSTLPSPSGRTYARSVSEAKEQLQKQALKAELQALGIQHDSWGAHMITKLGSISPDSESSTIVDLVKSGKVTLLLPAEKIDFPTTVQLANLLDHLLLPSPPLTPASQDTSRSFVSLSGLRGTIAEGRVTFTGCGLAVRASEHGIVRRSTLEPIVDFASEDLHRYLRGPASTSSTSDSHTFPHFAAQSPVSTLSLPRTATAAPSAIAAASRTNTSSRLAALFSKASSAELPPASTSNPSEPLSSSSGGPSSTKSSANLEISVLVIPTPVRFSEVSKQIRTRSADKLEADLFTLDGLRGDRTAIERITTFSNKFNPPSSAWTSVFGPTGTGAPLSAPPPNPSSTSSLFRADIEIITEAFQDVLHDVRNDLSRNLSVASPTAAPTSASHEDDRGALEDFGALEERVDSALSQVEDSLLSTSLYSHVFCPPFSSDAQDDENLASRIAALNVLELSLEHLGVELGTEEEGLPGWESQKRGVRETVEDLADTVGRELARLEDPADMTPSSKLDVFVQVHKILVEELGKLPPIPLKKEIDPATALSEQSHEVEMDDASSRASSRAPSRPRSPTPIASHAETTDDELLKTPRPPPAGDQDVPEIKLPDPSAPAPVDTELSSSMHEATSSSMFEPFSSSNRSPPPSIFDTTARQRSASTSSSLHGRSMSSSTPTSTSGADLILPLLIYSVVRSNPPRLISHLKFSHRFRSESLMRGQASYCLTNFDAVVEFLNHVDVSSLGLSSQKVLAATSPSFNSTGSSAGSPATTGNRPRAYTTGRLSSRLTSEMPLGLIDSANTALSGVVDSSYRMLFGPKGLSAIASGVGGAAPKSLDEVRGVLEGARGRARIGLPFRRSTSVNTLPGDARLPSTTTNTAPESALGETNQAALPAKEMIDLPGGSPDVTPSEYTPPSSPSQSRSSFKPNEGDRASPAKPVNREDDTRSIRSISSLIRDTTIGRNLVGESTSVGSANGSGTEERPSFGERLSNISGLARFGSVTGSTSPDLKSNPSSTTRASLFSAFAGPNSGVTSPNSPRRLSLLNPTLSDPPATVEEPSNLLGSRTQTPSLRSNGSTSTFQPIQRFLEINSIDELKLGEVRMLLDSYRELVAVWESERDR